MPSETTRQLQGVLRRTRALTIAENLLAPCDGDLLLDASGLAGIDAYGGATVRAALDASLEGGRNGTVTVREPTRPEPWSMLCNLLGALPAGSAWAGSRELAAPDRCVILPCLPLADSETVQLLVEEALPKAGRALGYQPSALRAMQEAAAVFAENARSHGAGAATPPLLCAAWDRQGNDLQLVVLDRGPSVPPPEEGEQCMRDAMARSRQQGFGELAGLARRRAGLDLSVKLAHGTGRARFRTGQGWHYDSASPVPGFVAGFEVHQ